MLCCAMSCHVAFVMFCHFPSCCCCYVPLCDVTLRVVMLCSFLHCYVMCWCAILSHFVACVAVLCHVMLLFATLRYVTLCYVMVSLIGLCCVVLCCVMLCCALLARLCHGMLFYYLLGCVLMLYDVTCNAMRVLYRFVPSRHVMWCCV